MRITKVFVETMATFLMVGSALALPERAEAHCDTMDGPVVAAARAALEQQDVGLALIWVKGTDEPEIREAFQRAVEVRKLGPVAGTLADRWFFETLVRVHRAGEGEPFTGLKPAGQDLGPAIPAADRAIQQGDLAPVVNLVTEAVRRSLGEHFEAVMAARTYTAGDVAAGRRYVEHYVQFLHQAEALWHAANHPSAGQLEEGGESVRHAH